MKQTAVEWLLKQIEIKNGKEFSSYYFEFIEQAKEMEKEQIMDAWIATDNELQRIAAEQYYNETYGHNHTS
ncbi:MAG: hypothetical protein ACK518_01825 [bacterium]|jgi:hypothetical protein